jgi:tRNA nucleotidyltransferase (CCA-adding enzyme)
MKIYLVGGAVRDKFLKLPIIERDYVVVGANSSEMLTNGFKKVGKDFPVYLHPTTKEEYALARTEKKNGIGYYGFSCDSNQSISLEEDLLRRDLTINAMAIDENDNLIDPYNGLSDINNKILRHVSNAFIEDPLRVLRVARFAARFYYLGFKVAPETLCLMRRIVGSNELQYLTKERVWKELEKSLSERNPEIFFYILRESGALKILFPEIDRLFGVPSSIKYHKEVDTGIHSLMVLSVASKLSNDPVIRFAALLHDLGKGVNEINKWPKQTGHEELGADVISSLCDRLNIPNKYRKQALMAAKLHGLVHKSQSLSAADIVNLLENADAFRNPKNFFDLLMVCKADFAGRGLQAKFANIAWYFPTCALDNDPYDVKNYTQEDFMRNIYEICIKIDFTSIDSNKLNGDEIKIAIHNKRVNCVTQYIGINSHER